MTKKPQRIYDWPETRERLHDIALSLMKAPEETKEDARVLCHDTDEFHPFDNDGCLQEALDRISRGDLYDAMDGIESAEEAAEMCVQEIVDKMTEYFDNSWNHAPGYKKPLLEFDPVPYGTSILKKILTPYGLRVYKNVIARSKVEVKRHEQVKRALAGNAIKVRNVTTRLLHDTFYSRPKLRLWLTKQVAKKKRSSITWLSRDVTSRLLKTLRFPLVHRWRAVDMIWRRVTPIVKSEISARENTA